VSYCQVLTLHRFFELFYFLCGVFLFWTSFLETASAVCHYQHCFPGILPLGQLHLLEGLSLTVLLVNSSQIFLSDAVKMVYELVDWCVCVMIVMLTLENRGATLSLSMSSSILHLVKAISDL